MTLGRSPTGPLPTGADDAFGVPALTTTRTIALRSTVVPCEMLCEAIVLGGSPGMLCDVSRVIPREPANDRAFATGIPTKLGITTGFGPSETTSMMRLASGTFAPGLGV